MLEDEHVTPLSRGKTSIDLKKIKTLNKLLAAGFDQEKAIAGMSIDQILKLPGVKLDDIRYINELQKSIRENKLISFFSHAGEQKTVSPERIAAAHAVDTD